MSKELNLEEVGRLAGVSRSTVSRVLNRLPNVSESARQSVERVIAETGYRPHAAAKSLASNRTGVIALVIPSAVETLFDDPYFGRLMLGVSSATTELDLTLALFLSEQTTDVVSSIRRVMNPGLADGVIITATQMGNPLFDQLQNARRPFVVVGRPDDPDCCSSVDADNRGGAELAARHLIDTGRRRVVYLGAPMNTTAGVDRRDGFLDGLRTAGLDLVAQRFGDWSQESGRRAMAELLAYQPDGVFVGSDRMALGALRAIAAAGLRCPDDIGLVSFDGLLSETQLTSIAQPVRAVGERAVALLAKQIEAPQGPPERIVLGTDLVVRESCGAGDYRTK